MFYSLPEGALASEPRYFEMPPIGWVSVEITNEPPEGAKDLRLVRDSGGYPVQPLQAEWIALTPEFVPIPPNVSTFYHSIQASDEFQALDSWAILNGVEPAAILLSRAMSVVLEAKAYAEQFGGNDTSFAAMGARLNQFVESLDDATDYGGTNKAAIVDRIIQAVTDGNLPITITLTV